MKNLVEFILKKTVFFILFTLQISAQNLPPSFTGLSVWLSSDSIKADAFDNVFKWEDLSGNNNYAFQTTNTKQPKKKYNTSQLNGKSTIHLDGDDDFLEISDAISVDFTDGFTMFIVIKQEIVASIEALLCKWDFGTQGSWYIETGASNGLTTYVLDAINGGGGNQVQATNNIALDKYNIISIKYDGTQSTNNRVSTYINGTLLSSSTIGSINPTLVNSGASIIIGGFTNLGRYFNGDFSEIIIYNQAMNNTDRQNIELYLNNKFAPDIHLPPDLLSLNSLCSQTITPINSNNNQYTNYQWSTGATTPSLSVNKSGKYWVKATNIFGIESSDTIVVNYPKINSFKDSVFCNGNSINWDTKLSKNNFSFLWQDGSTTDSIFTISQSGQYHVKITDSFGCFIESDTITATVDDFENIASLGPDTNLCAGNPIQIKTGLQAGLTYTWSNGSNTPTLPITTGGQYSVVVTNTNNCVAKDTINVTIIGQAPTANYFNSLACQTKTITFTDNSMPPVGDTISNWHWDFGVSNIQTDTSNIKNPFYAFADTGNYIVNLTVTTGASCKQSFTKNIHVAPNPTTLFNNIIACKNDSAVFTNSSSSPNYTPLTYLWNFGDVASGLNNTSSLQLPKHLFNQQQTYTVNLTTTNNAGCSATNTKTIAVKAQVTANFTTSAPCVNQPIIYTDNSIVPAPNNQNIRIWNFGTSSSQGNTAIQFYTTTGTYPVTLTVNGSNGCVSSFSKTIDVGLSPIPNFSVNNVCLNDTLHFIDLSSAQSGTLANWNWNKNGSQFSSVQNPSLIANSAATIPVKLIVTNSFGCKDSTLKSYTVYPLPVVDYVTSPQNYYTVNTPITFSPSISNATTTWNFSNHPSSQATNPTVTYTATGTYTTSLFLTDANGCSGFKTKTTTVSDIITDVAVLNVYLEKSNTNYITVSTDIVNYGSTPLTRLDLLYTIPNASNIKETWQGVLNPGSLITYTFLASSKLVNSSDNNPVCVSVNLTNNEFDVNLNNNALCSILNANTIEVLSPYPNPSDNNITLPIILNKDLSYVVEIYDALGQIMFEQQDIKGLQGLNQLTIPVLNFSRGAYVLKLYIDNKLFIKKIVRAGK